DSDKYKYQDAYYWKDGPNENVELVGFRVFNDSKEDLQEKQIDMPDEEETKRESQISSETEIEMMESNHQISSVSSQAVVPSSDEVLPAKDILLQTAKADLPFPMITNFPDVVVKIGKNKFPTTKKVLCDYSEYFYERLASNKERLCVLKVDEKFVNPEAFKTILQFLCFKQPFTGQNLTKEVIHTATFLGMPLIICKIETILYHRIGSVENALAKLSLISEMREHLEKCPSVANLPFKKTQVTVKGQRGNLKDKHLLEMCHLEHIWKEKEWFFKASIERDRERSICEKIVMRPHVLVEKAESLTLWVFNVFNHNYKDAVYVNLEDYKKSLEDGLRGCTEFLANRIEEVALRSDCLTWNKALIDMMDEAMTKDEDAVTNQSFLQRTLKEKRLMVWELHKSECKILNPGLKTTDEE
ncbi:hypothetical protein JTE90_017715, partial [Oedothorax gibbosus]